MIDLQMPFFLKDRKDTDELEIERLSNEVIRLTIQNTAMARRIMDLILEGKNR
jgi:hypothetical protein